MATRAVLLLWLFSSVGGAHAQDMDLTQDSGPQDVPAAAGPPSAMLARALRSYDVGDHAAAAVQLQHVVEGASDDGAANVQRAELALAKSLVHLGFDESALALLDGIANTGRGHRHFADALPWLATLARRMPDPAPLALAVGRYRPGDLRDLASKLGDGGEQTVAELRYLMGRQAYADGELKRAVRLLALVPPQSARGLEALFVRSLAHVRMRRARPAIASLRAMLTTIEDGGGHPDAEAMRNLAWLSLGRVYYTAGMQEPAGSEQGGKLIGAAVDAFSRVDSSSDHWLDALFESSWALFVSDQHARALGNLHALLSPYFPGAFYPEAYVLKAVTFFQACQMGNAMAMVQTFRERYDGLRRGLAALATKREAGAGYALLQRLRTGEAPGSERLVAVLRRALGDREVERQLARLGAVADQRTRLARSERALLGSTLAERIAQDLDLAESFATDHLDSLVMARVRRLGNGVQELANQMDTVEIEILNYQRGALNAGVAARSVVDTNPSGGEVHVDSEHYLWPFNGEYWRDELGYYRQRVTHQCAAR